MINLKILQHRYGLDTVTASIRLSFKKAYNYGKFNKNATFKLDIDILLEFYKKLLLAIIIDLEIMFKDFITICFDGIVNHAAKLGIISDD